MNIKTALIQKIILYVGVQYCLSMVYLIYYQTFSFPNICYGKIMKIFLSAKYHISYDLDDIQN